MLRTNLATRPFYNERAVKTAIAGIVVVVAALTAFNALEVASLNRENSEFNARADMATARARELRQQAQVLRQSLNKEELKVVQDAAYEANLLIERRAFSWTDLFNRFEQTLPADVRIAAVQPQIDEEGRMLVAINVIARRIEDLDTFSDALEGTGAFSDMVSRQDETQDDGTLRAVLQGYYEPNDAATRKPANDPAAVSAPATSDSSGGGKTNETPNATPSTPVKPPTGGPR